MKRESWENFFIRNAVLVSTRSTCIRRSVGAILVKDKRIISSGFNGCPTGTKHCFETGCLREQRKVPSGERHELCRGVHAEQNTIIQAAVFGVSIANSILYTTTFPCSTCAKMLVNSKIKKIFYLNGYPDSLSSNILEETDIEVVKIEIIDTGDILCAQNIKEK